MSRRAAPAVGIGTGMADHIQFLDSARFVYNFEEVDTIEYLNCDQRPAFALELDVDGDSEGAFSVLAFRNNALLNSSELCKIVTRTFSLKDNKNQHPNERAFAEWVLQQPAFKGRRRSKVFFDILWTVALKSDGWAIVSGVELSQCDFGSFSGVEDSERKSQQQDIAMQDTSSRNSSSNMDTDASSTSASTRPRAPLGEIWPPSGLRTSAHIRWIREYDWASTPIGPIDTWSPQLRQACEMMLVSPEPTTIFWGSDLTLIYNEAYVALAGNKHPSMMGGSARIHWKEVWDQYDPLFDQIRIDGKAFKQDNAQLFIHRRGYLEEGFFTLLVMPLLGEDGSVVGFYEPVSEVTKQTLSERRMHVLLKLSKHTSAATSLRDLWRLLLEILSGHLDCIHFAMLYSLQHGNPPLLNSRYSLEGAVGFAGDTSSFQPTMSIYDPSQDGIMPALRKAHGTRSTVLLTTSDESLSSSILQMLKDAGMTEAPRELVVYPLSSSVDESVEAFIIIGISPRRPYDDDYQLFVNLLVRQIESTITFVKLFENEKERLRQQVVYESELKFKKFAENAMVGIVSFDLQGRITFCNDSWLQLTGHDRNDGSAMAWTKDLHPDNAIEIRQYWEKVARGEGTQTFEVQYKKPWKPKNRDDDTISLDRTWVVASAYAETSEAGRVTGVLGCVTDISSWKWVDQLQSQRLSEALELKRQQENFLDITSHEMRNPLNAILHCAAELIELLSNLTAGVATDERASTLDNCLDASRTIVYCGRHQKRIIDDVLTLSKLDSNLLSISPVETQPLDVVEEVLKVFDTELRASSIQTKTELADSYTALRIESVLIDPHRVIQILINLVANAIKFTKGESLRSLHIVIGAYSTEPVSSNTGVRYVPSGRCPTDPTGQAEWGKGNIVFLHFSVKDTGPGMSREEANLLFNRFAQGSPRTHVQYGGSGLGLFISRELAELHGGRIGISSELGFGSTFDFYVKGRRSEKEWSRRPSADAASNVSIPTKPVPNRPVSDGPPPPLSHTSKSSPSVLQQPASPPGVHVLIVEDNLINQKILAKLMRKQGYAVSIANHGEEALAVIHGSTWHRLVPASSSKQPLRLDVVLADIEMPVMDGKEFVRRVRQLQNEATLTGNIPVIAVTGNARSEQIQQAKECGFDHVVSKPYKVEDLLLGIQKYTSREER